MKVKANGIQINFELSGKKGASVLMLSHSLGCSLAMWKPQLQFLERDYRVLRYDTRGHGRTDAPSGAYTFNMLGADAIALLDVLGIDMVHWVGLSMGGMIGQFLALNHPDRIRSLALCDTAAIIPQEAQPLWRERIKAAGDKGMQVLVESTLERWFTRSYLRKNPPGVNLIRNQFLATPVAGYIGCSEAIRTLNYLEALAEIKKPTIIIVGEDDPGTPVATSKAMHKRIHGSKLVVIASAAHLSSVEQPEAFNNALIEFLKDQTG